MLIGLANFLFAGLCVLFFCRGEKLWVGAVKGLITVLEVVKQQLCGFRSLSSREEPAEGTGHKRSLSHHIPLRSMSFAAPSSRSSMPQRVSLCKHSQTKTVILIFAFHIDLQQKKRPPGRFPKTYSAQN